MFTLRKLSLGSLGIAVLFVIATFLRLYNLEGALQFQGDQGRDSLIVSRIFTQHDPVFIGPVTSVGNMYLGPLYYYFMLPFLWMSYPSPMGPVYAVAVLGIITVFLMYFLGKKLVGEKPALVATTLFTFSWVVLTYTRFSWNPNPAPLVSLLMMFWTYWAWQKNRWYWVLVALCFSVLLQLHYLAMLSAGGAGIIWLLDFRERWMGASKKRWSSVRQLLIPTVVGVTVVLASFTPLMLFDSKHEWLNAKAFQKLVFKEENFKATAQQLGFFEKIITTIKEMHGRGMHIFFEITIGKVRWLNTLLLFLVIGCLGWLFKQRAKRSTHAGEVVLIAYAATGIIGTAFYEHTIFDHYIAYLFPATFLLLGTVLTSISQKKLGLIASALFIAYFFWYNIPRLPLRSAGWTTADMKAVSETIYQRVEPGEKYNIVLLSSTGDIDGQNYRYFLSTTDKPPVPTEERGSVETLFIINEDRKLAKVVDSPVYEIVVFPDKQPKEVYTAHNGPEVTVLSTRQK